MVYYAGYGGSITINNAESLPLVVNITRLDASATIAYSDAARTVVVAFPDVTTVAKTYYFADEGNFVISTKYEGIELAYKTGSTVTIALAGGAGTTIAPTLANTPLASAVTGAGYYNLGGLTSGESTIPTMLATSAAVTFTSGTMLFTRFIAAKTEPITQIKVYCSTPAAVSPTLIRHGIYTVATDGSLTLVASHASDLTLYGATATGYTKALTSTFNKVAGQVYYFGALQVATTTATSIGLVLGGGPISTDAPRAVIQLTSQSDLPATVSAATIAGSSTNTRMQYALLVP